MKSIIPIALAVACIALVIALVMTKRGDDAQHETDAGAIAGYSNQLASAELQVVIREGTMLTFSNHLDESMVAFQVCSNQLLEAQSNLVLNLAVHAQQITNLNRQVAEMTSENQGLGRRAMAFTNQITGLTGQIAVLGANLAQTNNDLVQAYRDYALLENRFRIDVAERTVVERRFNNPMELQTQLKKLKKNPAGVVSAEAIYAGLNVEVKTNGWCHVITPN
jgi:hypothetical protein